MASHPVASHPLAAHPMAAQPPGFAEANQTTFAPRDAAFEYVTLGKAGRFVIPVTMRDAMGLTDGDRIMVSLDDGVLTLESQASVVRRLQAECMALARPGTSVVDDLISDRRREAAREAEEFAKASRLRK